MGMRLEITFARPLSSEERCLAQMGLAALAGTRAVMFAQAGTRAFVSGEALLAGAIELALRADGLPVATVTGAEMRAPAQVASGGAPIVDERERFRPMGR
jgi:hypothetical protein